MDVNVILNGSVRLRKGSTWRGQHDLEDLSLVKHATDLSKCGLYKVSFSVESVIPLHTVKLYSLTRQRYHAFTKSAILSDFLSQVYKPMSSFQQPKYALLICIRNSGIVPANPFDDSEATYPLAKESYILLMGRRCGGNSNSPHDTTTISLQVFGQVLRDRFDYPNFYNLSNTHGLTEIPSLTTFGDNNNNNNNKTTDNDDDNAGANSSSNKDPTLEIANSILRSYRQDLLSSTTNHPTDASHNQQQQQQSWKSLLKKDMDRLGKLDQLRDESKRSRPERTLNVAKRKHLPQRKSSNILPPPLPVPPSPSTQSTPSTPSLPLLPSALKKSASASSILSSKTLKRQPSLPCVTTTSLQKSTKSNIPSDPASASSSSLKPPPQSSQSQLVTESSHHDTNKKRLKSTIWSKLLQQGHDKKADDTKQLYHCIYQSMQYTLRKTFKTDLLDLQLMDSLIDSHIHFYSSLELSNDLLE